MLLRGPVKVLPLRVVPNVRQALLNHQAHRRPFINSCSIPKTAQRCSSSSSKRWQARQGKDKFTKEARVQGLMSRAAFKLLEINEKYKIFKQGQTVIDLGYAPGSWSQVAVDRTMPNGRVIGIDIIPAQPPKGVSTIQGNFLSEAVREQVKQFVRDPNKGKLNDPNALNSEIMVDNANTSFKALTPGAALSTDSSENSQPSPGSEVERGASVAHRLVVDVVLSDMSAPWEQTTGFHKRSLSDPYYRMMNTSGMNFRDHAGSMDLCLAALKFSFDTLRVGGSFVCKFYQGVEDKAFEKRLKSLFARVYREKPESSRSESREAYFVAIRRRADVPMENVFGP